MNHFNKNYCFDSYLDEKSLQEMRELLEESDIEDVINYSLHFTYEVLKLKARRYELMFMPLKLDGTHDESRRPIIMKDDEDE